MTSGAPCPDETETARALQALVSDPYFARKAVSILCEELQAARGPERQAIAITITMIEQRALDLATPSFDDSA
jgi:hypothetical protein